MKRFAFVPVLLAFLVSGMAQSHFVTPFTFSSTTVRDASAVNLGGTTVGLALFRAANPGAVRYARVNADNTVTFLDAAAFVTAIGAADGTTAVTLTGTQTLTNKTLTAPVVNSPTGIVKGDVGLGNVDNTSDANKPVSTATQTALDLKLDDSQATAFGLSLIDDADAAAGRATLVLQNVDNTSDADKPVSTATQTALDAKVDETGGTASGLTLSGLTTVSGTAQGGTVDPVTLRINGDSASVAMRMAEDDVRAYLLRTSVAEVGNTGTNVTSISEPDKVRLAIAAIYSAVGKENLIDAWFLGSTVNLISGTTVPAFLSSANNGVKVGTVVPVTGTDGTLFVKSSTHSILLPTSLSSTLTTFTDIVVCEPSGDNVARGALGNLAADAGAGTAGYVSYVVNSTTPNQQNFNFTFSGSSTGNSQTMLAKPNGNRWQTYAISYTSGTQRMYLDGRLVLSGTSTEPIWTNDRQLTIGASGWRIGTAAQNSGFEGKIIFVAKLRTIPTPDAMAYICSAIRAAVSPERGRINLITEGDSRTDGMDFSSGTFSPDITTDPETNWGIQLQDQSNWGNATTIRIGCSSDTIHDIVGANQFDAQARPVGQWGWQKNYLTIWAGVNDWTYGTGDNTAQYVYDKTAAYVAKAQAQGYKVIVIGQPPSSNGTINTKVLAFNALMDASPVGDYWIPIYDDFPVGSLYDGLHLTAAGETALAGIINAAVSPTVEGSIQFVPYAPPALQPGTAISNISGLQTALDLKLDDSQATAFGLSLLDDADATAGRATLELVIGTNVQAWDADLDGWAGKTVPTGTVVFSGTDSTFTDNTIPRADGTTGLFQKSGVTIDDGNNLTTNAAVNVADTFASNRIGWSSSSRMKAVSDGRIALFNAALSDFSLLQFGGTTSSFPAFKRNGATLQVRLADDSGDAAFTAQNFTGSASGVNTGDQTISISGILTAAGSAGVLTPAFSYVGTGTLAAGTATVVNAAFSATSVISVTPHAAGTLSGPIRAATFSGSATFTSSGGSDDAEFDWVILR